MFPSGEERVLAVCLGVPALVAGTIVLAMAVLMALEAWPVLASAGPARFVTDPDWFPEPAAAEGTFNLLPMVAASLCAMLGALTVAAPLGLLSAVFINDYAPRAVAAVYRRLLELLAGVPSVVFGLWGLMVLVPLIGAWRSPGTSLLAGIAVLALMILPTAALTADAAIRAVPSAHRRTASALGLGRATTVWRVVVPAAGAGIGGGLVLAAGRALGETMAVLMVAGNVVRYPTDLLEPVRLLTANIALELGYALGDHRAALFVSALGLAAVIAAAVLAARALGLRMQDA